MRTESPSADAGMTLIELIISVLILALVVGPLVMVLQFSFSAANAASHRTTDSSGAQLLSSYFAADVQASDFVWTQDRQTAFDTAPYTTRCGNAQTQLEMQNSDAASGTIHAVTYNLVDPGDATSDSSLARYTWDVTGASCNKTGSSVLVDAVDTDNLPTVVCSPTNCKSPDTIHLTVDALSKAVHNSNLYSTFTFDLTATRRTG